MTLLLYRYIDMAFRKDFEIMSCGAAAFEIRYFKFLLHILAEHMSMQDQEEDELIKMLHEKRNEGKCKHS